MAGKMYAWATIYNGGETQEDVRTGRNLVVERNVIQPGSVVVPKDVGGQEAFDEMVENGSIRPYKLPEDMNEGESPLEAVNRGLWKEGVIDQDKLLELTLIDPSASTLNPPASEGKEVEKPSGA